MRILVIVKQVFASPESLQLCENHIDFERAPKQTSSLDLVAIEQAVLLKEQGLASHISVCTIGDQGAEQSLRTALAMGAEQAFHIGADLEALEPLGFAQLLKAFMAGRDFDLVLTGREDFDGEAGICPVMLGALLSWPCIDFVTKMRCVENQTIELGCESPNGGAQTVTLALPAIVSADMGLNEPRFVKFPALMKARKAEVTFLPSQTLCPDYRPQYTTLALKTVANDRKQVLLSDVEALAHVIKEKMD